jgi:NAD(P)-dependent dehydrogenase (short-subunit alcohol dehydrogenase family)
MSFSLKPLARQVMVITGASSGIGLATARAAAKQGARVVLASRNDESLAEIEQQIQNSGGKAVHVAADVSREEDVQRIADTAVQRFGGFDTWVNNAGLSVVGRIEEVAIEDFRQIFEVNFWGLVYGSRIAVAHLKQKGGALINLGSVASDVALPLQGMYAASKHAIKGFTDALRMELEQEGAPISVTLIKPASINTPFPHHAKNYTDKEPKLPPPVYPPEEVARAILHAATHQVRDLYVGGGGKAMSTVGAVAPGAMDWAGSHILANQQARQESPRNPAGALYQAGRDGHVHGDHPGYVRKTSLYTEAAMHPAIVGAMLAGVGFAVAAWMGRGEN